MELALCENNGIKCELSRIKQRERIKIRNSRHAPDWYNSETEDTSAL